MFDTTRRLDAHAPPRLLLLVEDQRHRVALNMYFSFSSARCIFALSPSLWKIPETLPREKIVFACVERALKADYGPKFTQRKDQADALTQS